MTEPSPAAEFASALADHAIDNLKLNILGHGYCPCGPCALRVVRAMAVQLIDEAAYEITTMCEPAKHDIALAKLTVACTALGEAVTETLETTKRNVKLGEAQGTC